MTAQLSHKGTQVRTTESATPAVRGRLRGAWRRFRLTIQEMNHATRRVVEVQAPWSVDKQWHSR